jgi:hypothetical protein
MMIEVKSNDMKKKKKKKSCNSSKNCVEFVSECGVYTPNIAQTKKVSTYDTAVCICLLSSWYLISPPYVHCKTK